MNRKEKIDKNLHRLLLIMIIIIIIITATNAITIIKTVYKYA